MKKYFSLFLITTLLVFPGLGCSVTTEKVESKAKKDVLAGAIPGLTVNNLMASQLELVEGTEVVVSHVEIPAKTTLPKHWHPGEEFLYLLKGSGTLWQEDKSDTQLKEGNVFKVPLKEIHTFTSDEDGATILVFRVHEKGQPVRVNVE